MSKDDRKPLAIHGPLSALGVIAGLIAAGTIVPEGCAFTEAQATRLHIALPLAMPLSLLVGALWFAKYLTPRPREKPRLWIFITLAIVLAGEALFNLAAGITYNPSDALSSSLAAWVIFWPLLVALVPTVIALVDRARVATSVRPSSLTFGVARRQVWLIVLASIAPLEALLCGIRHGPVSVLAFVAWVAGLMAIPLAAGFVIADGRASSRVEEALKGTRPCEPDEALSEDVAVVDLGIGDDLYLPPFADGRQRYRGAAGVTAVVRGAPAAVRQFLANARRRSAILLVVSIASSIASSLILAENARAAPIEEINTTPFRIPWIGGC